MKLIDFLTFEPFLELHKNMGIKDKVEFNFDNSFTPLKIEEILKKLSNGEDIELTDLNDIECLSDGTLALYGQKRILIYIRDHNGDIADPNPRFHVSECSAIVQMKNINRFKKYVIHQKENDIFQLNVASNMIQKKLVLCIPCRTKIRWEGEFTLSKYFQKYTKDVILNPPIYNSVTAPKNDYSSNWDEIKQSYKTEYNYKCQKCFINLNENKKYLDVHHMDGMKYNNNKSNLKVLCIECHSNEFNHHHMKADKRYIEFMGLKNSIKTNIHSKFKNNFN